MKSCQYRNYIWTVYVQWVIMVMLLNYTKLVMFTSIYLHLHLCVLTKVCVCVCMTRHGGKLFKVCFTKLFLV